MNNLISKEPEFNYYVLSTENDSITIKDLERKEEVKPILKNMDEGLNLFLLKEIKC